MLSEAVHLTCTVCRGGGCHQVHTAWPALLFKVCGAGAVQPPPAGAPTYCLLQGGVHHLALAGHRDGVRRRRQPTAVCREEVAAAGVGGTLLLPAGMAAGSGRKCNCGQAMTGFGRTAPVKVVWSVLNSTTHRAISGLVPALQGRQVHIMLVVQHPLLRMFL